MCFFNIFCFKCIIISTKLVVSKKSKIVAKNAYFKTRKWTWMDLNQWEAGHGGNTAHVVRVTGHPDVTILTP